MGNSTNQVTHPRDAAEGVDLNAGDYVETVDVHNAQALVIAANSEDNGNWSVSVSWQNGNGSVFLTESATDIGLDTTDDDWARLVRKGPACEVTLTDESGAQNRTNIWLDTHR